MEQDSLDKFITENKDGFNNLDVPPMIWNVIEKETKSISTRSSFRLPHLVRKVAAAILIFATAWYLNDFLDAPKNKIVREPTKVAETNSPLLNELSDAEAYYTTQINLRQSELEKVAKEHPEILEDLKKEFIDLEKNNVELKKDLAESNADEKVIEAIIQSYRIKLEILEQMLSEMQNGSNAKQEVSTNL